MSYKTCPHCNETYLELGDGFCPNCREELDAPVASHEIAEYEEDTEGEEVGSEFQYETNSMPNGILVVDINETSWPNICLLCGMSADTYVRIRFHRQHAVKKSLLKWILNLNFIGELFLDEAFDERPIYFTFPVCSNHMNDNRLALIESQASGHRQTRIVGLHPKFVIAAKEHFDNRWEKISQKYDND